jgi:hypothetical protein
METKAARRALNFRDLDEVVEDARRLHRHGYEKAGAWDLAQVSGHLADWMRFPLDGFPRPPLPIRLMLGALRATVGRRTLREILATRSMPGRRPTMPESVPAAGGDEAGAIERFGQVVERFKAHSGPFHPSPLFGVLNREQATQLQLIHCAHHLSFLVPRPPQSAPDRP